MTEPPWLQIAEKYVGFHETGNNRGIEHFIDLAHTGSLGDPWCAIFVNACLEEAGLRGSRSPAARSFEHNANFSPLSEPKLGCIVTRWRGSPSSGLGHVYFYLGEDANGIHALAGNEDDQVQEYYEPTGPVTGFWWPTGGAQMPADPTVLFQVTGKMSIFGGPDDSGSGNPDEGLALFSSEAQMREHGLGDYILPPNGFGLFRRLNTEKNYIACRWVYSDTPVAFLRDARVAVIAGDKSAWARPVDWGPNIRTGRVADLSPGLAKALGVETDDTVTVIVKSAREPPGPVPAPQPAPEPIPMPPTTLPVPAPDIWKPHLDADQVTQILRLNMELLKELKEARASKPPPPPAGSNPMAAMIPFFAWIVSVLPQIAAIMVPIVQALVSSGVMGPVIGDGATPTGRTVGASVAATAVLGIFNWVKTKWFTPPPAQPHPAPIGPGQLRGNMT